MKARRAPGARGEEETRDREPFGELVQRDREEDERAERRAGGRGARDRDAVHDGVHQQSDERRDAHELRDRVRLLAEVEVRRERVLREVHGEEAAERDRRAADLAASGEGVRQHVEHRDGDHEARRERDHEFERAHAPRRAPGDGGRAGEVRRRGGERVRERASRGLERERAGARRAPRR